MAWTPPSRNFDNIQFETLRKTVDGKFNTVHDELSDCYYNGKPFRTFGILTKEKFDKLHGLIFVLRDIAFHQENFKSPPPKRIPEDEYNYVDIEKTIKKSDRALQIRDALAAEGIELVIT